MQAISYKKHSKGQGGICLILQCGLITLETRRLRGDQIEVFKIVNGYEDVDRNVLQT